MSQAQQVCKKRPTWGTNRPLTRSTAAGQQKNADLRQNLRHKGKRIVFIHGVGDGILSQAIRKELDEVFALSCSYTFGPMGATNVTIR